MTTIQQHFKDVLHVALCCWASVLKVGQKGPKSVSSSISLTMFNLTAFPGPSLVNVYCRGVDCRHKLLLGGFVFLCLLIFQCLNV